ILFYMNVVNDHIQELEQLLGYPLITTPLVISGMAGSSIGMIQLPYKDVPFVVDGSDLITKTIQDEKYFNSLTLVISGAKTSEDVMRGEETQLVGCLQQRDGTGKQILVFTGTHSKHVAVEGDKVTSFKTYMTGEFFELLLKKSILSDSVEKGSGLVEERNRRSFNKGVADSIESNLLHGSFLVRTNELFKKFTKEENYYYLSGLLIGTEVNELADLRYEKMILVTTSAMRPYYETSFDILGMGKSMEICDADQALIRGQFNILQQAMR
ncbi:MAG TPA: 2-dehydro-3-deoxygalactonokinase, partial [Chitinophagaceae bacterium]|nr:2-dehydro-3-deoxygalactonokinase [Chitinophagaceae bacterium]